jgi:lipoprotein-anchoring transpeptidase ErfK/SrfK
MLETTTPITSKSILVSIDKKKLYAYDNRRPIVIADISWGEDTPKGIFSITGKIESTPTNIPEKPWILENCLVFMKSEKDGHQVYYAIHAVPKTRDGEEVKQPLGLPNSEGCIRVDALSAKHLYDWAEVGTPVVIA